MDRRTKRATIPGLSDMKRRGKKIAMLTAYDHPPRGSWTGLVRRRSR